MICGATGLVGGALAKCPHEDGHDLVLVGRDPKKLRETCSFGTEFLTLDELLALDPQDIDVIFNLAGASVGDKRWTTAYKQVMRESPIGTTARCVEMCKKNPRTVLSTLLQ